MKRFAPLLTLASIQKQLQGLQVSDERTAVRQAFDEEALRFISYLGTLKVSQLSSFIDEMWDFNADFPNVAFSAKGRPQQLHFSKFTHLPLCACWELKAVFVLRLMAPGLAQVGRGSGASTERPMKPRTLIGIFTDGLRFSTSSLSSLPPTWALSTLRCITARSRISPLATTSRRRESMTMRMNQS